MIASITFMGATGTVTGSRYLLEAEGKKYLVDCGLFQGLKEIRQRNWEPFPIPPNEIDRVLLTHAHVDHCGYLPRIVQQGFKGPVHCTWPTADICSLVLRDSAHLQEEDARYANKKGFSKHKPALPLYTVQDAEDAISLFKPVNYGQDLFFSDTMRIKFKDAGHILGSSFIDVKLMQADKPTRILFSGDIGSPDRPILRDPAQVFEVDYLVLESTYGDRTHGHGDEERRTELARVINESIKRGGILIIPSFAVERSQELLYYIRELEDQKRIPVTPVYLDSPMAVSATEVFEKWKLVYDMEARMKELDGKHIMQTKMLHVVRDAEESKLLHNVKGPAIFISASGMLEGGRILHHLEHRLPFAENTVLFVGYQAEGTRGRSILNGSPTVKIHGQQVPIKAKIENITGFSGHADYKEILAWLMGFNRPPIKTFIVHGEPEASKSMAEKIRATLGWQVEIPEFMQTVNLG